VSAPVIGLSAYATRAAWGVWDMDAVLLPQPYVAAVAAAGGVPVLLPPLPGVIAAVLPRLDGLLLAGGPDVDPARYGHERDPNTQPPKPERDVAEAELVGQALAADLPVLGICRGLQLLNVARGGSLLQHLPDHAELGDHGTQVGVFGSHPVRVAEGSRLAGALGRTEVAGVPAYHHQGVATLGAGLVATAWTADGLVEAVEDPGAAFCVAVQWHPEMGDDPALFRALVAAARDRRLQRA
jgi:putative glutamine amidotransferase